MTTRFAPSLTGYLHLGHVLHMLHVWGVARAKGGRVVCRIEDHDLSRRRPEYEAAILEDMEWLGFVPDEGMTASNAAGPSGYRQSDCHETYARVLQILNDHGLVYGCACSRKRIRGGATASSPADSEAAVTPFQELCYDGTCTAKGLPLEGNIVRFRVPAGDVEFLDHRLGWQRQNPKRQCGDFALRDRQGQWTYQFACVCDDIRQGIDWIMRGEDILSSTGRQILLFNALEAPVPQYIHHPLICDGAGMKLSKRQRSESIDQLRAVGATAEEVIGRAAHAGGLIPEFRNLPLEEALDLVQRRCFSK